LGITIKTPLYEKHKELGAKIVDFAGWDMPVYYSSVIDEHVTTRTKAGLFDISHMGEIFVRGKNAASFLQKILTNDIENLSDGKAFYSCMCTESGGVVDDLFVYRFSSSKYMLVVNASNIQKDFEWLLKKKEFFEDVFLENKSEEYAKLDLQGPKSEDILKIIVPGRITELKRFHFIELEVESVSTIISRTGYTGEDGFELYLPSGSASKVWDKILEVGSKFGIKPIGLGARDTLRIEACYSLYGHELTEEVNPFEGGVGFVVKMGKDDFFGMGVLSGIIDEGIIRKTVAFEMIERGIPREGYSVLSGGKEIGKVTSGTMSPTFKKGIGLARIDSTFEIGNEININIRKKSYKGKIVKRPIYEFHGR